ncbi:hypothetical protein J4G07_04085 [Candidatus Poribacteria bacterium]|nr:hypothetical protein [Candidatus Poribacteria bacterium]
MAKRADTRILGRHILGLTSVFLLTILPWTLWTAIQFPVEFQHEHLYIWFHLTADIENWGSPWHKVILVYGPVLYGIFYLPMSIAVLVLI